MNTCSTPMKPLLVAMTLGLLTLAGTPAGAADKYWSFGSGCSTKDFSSNCWSGSFPATGPALSAPGIDDIVFLHQSGETSLPITFANAAAPALTQIEALQINGTGTAFATLNVSAAGKRLEVGDMFIGTNGRGKLNQSGGEIYVGPVRKLVSTKIGNQDFNYYVDIGDGFIVLGEKTGSSGSYLMTGGMLNAISPYAGSVGFSAGIVVGLDGKGLMEVSGSANVESDILLGAFNGAIGEYKQSSGTTTAKYIEFGSGGEGGTGRFTMNGGTLNVGTVSSESAASSTFDLNGGTFNLAGAMTVTDLNIGNTSFIQRSNNPVNVTTLTLGTGDGQVARYRNDGGTLTVGNIQRVQGSGFFEMNGGTLNFTGSTINVSDFTLASLLSNPSTVTISTGQSLEAIDLNLRGQSTLNVLAGGSVLTGRTILGDSSNLAQVIGTVLVSGPGSTWVNTGNVTLAGTEQQAGGTGMLTVADQAKVVIGQTLRLWGKGTVNIDGGQLTTNTLAGVTGAVVNLKNGSFAVGDAGGLNSFAGTLNWTAGTLELNGNLSLSPTGALGENLLLSAGQQLKLKSAGSLVGGANSSVFLSGGSLKLDGNVVVGSFFVDSSGEQRFVHEGNRILNANQLGVGFGSSGAMTVRGGAQVNSGNAGFGGFGGSHGDVIVEGIGTRWGNSGNMVIGGNATGQLTVRDGGRVETVTAVLGGPATTSGFFQGPAGQGSVFVSGVGSAFVASGNVSVGGDATTAGGRSSLEVADGGLVQVGGTLKVWDEGTLQVRGGMLLASQLDNRGTLMGVGTVQADVSNSGRLAPGLSPGYLLLSGNFEQTSTGVLEIELHDISTYDQLAIEGGALLGGTLSLICSGGCRYDAGDSLQLVFAAGGLSGSFADITFSGLNPASFKLVYGADEVRLQVLSNVSPLPVPEPSTYAMLLAGLGVLGVVARRRSRQQQATPVTASL